MFFCRQELYHLIKPNDKNIPILISSPHSGRLYPSNLLKYSKLSLEELRKSEDSFIHELFKHAPELGGTLLMAELSRIFCDLNRWAWELDPKMFKNKLPSWCDIHSDRVKHGIGTVHKISNSGKLIFNYYLSFPYFEKLIRRYWFGYHQQIEKFIHINNLLYGGCIIIDVHSMPSPRMRTSAYADIILGDVFSQSCSPCLINQSALYFQSRGLIVKKNIPYAGGYITRHYGKPSKNIHTLQIEINKNLYMDEKSFQRNKSFLTIQKLIKEYMIWLFAQWSTFLKN